MLVERNCKLVLVECAAMDVDGIAGAPGSYIGLATGRRVGRLPDDLVLGLGLDEMASCIRKSSTPRNCVRRLKAASASKWARRRNRRHSL